MKTYPNFEIIAREGHGKVYLGDTAGLIRMNDDDGHTEYLKPFEGVTELEVITRYAELVHDEYMRRGETYFMHGENGSYFIESATALNLPLIGNEDDGFDHDHSSLKNFVARI